MNTPEQKKVLIEALVSLGFTESEAEEQIIRVGNLATAAVMDRVLKGVKEKVTSPASPEDIGKAVAETYPAGSFEVLIQEEAARVLSEYFKAITANLDPEKRDAFYEKVGITV